IDSKGRRVLRFVNVDKSVTRGRWERRSVVGLRGDGRGVVGRGRGIGVRARSRHGRFGVGAGVGAGNHCLGGGGGGGVDHHARGSRQFHFTLAAIAASQALFAEVVVAGILGATGANSGGFLSTDAASEWHGGLLLPS